jgi:hypothetical protein
VHLSFVPLSFMPLSGLKQNDLCLFPLCLFPFMLFPFLPLSFLPLSGLMENADYAGFLHANFRAPLRRKERERKKVGRKGSFSGTRHQRARDNLKGVRGAAAAKVTITTSH